MKNLIVFALILLSNLAQAQTNSAQEVASELVEKREAKKKEIIDTYLTLKDNLLLSDSLAVANSALEMSNVLKDFKFKKLKLEQMNFSVKTRKQLIQLASEISATNNIDKQREIFISFSDKFWMLADKFKAGDTSLYLQICPMTSVTWISSSKEIRNPYYPKNMLTCGEIKARL